MAYLLHDGIRDDKKCLPLHSEKSKRKWSPTGKTRGTSMKYSPTPLSAEALLRTSTKASAGYPPVAKSAEAAYFGT